MPVVEICKWTTSDLLVFDPSLIKPTMDYLVNVDGCLSAYYGLAEENNMICFLILVWETCGNHESLMNHPEFSQVIGSASSVSAGEVQTNRVEFTDDFIPLLNAPSTEISIFKLKEGKSKEDLYHVLQALVPKVAVLNHRHAPGSWGQTWEELDKFYLITGWNSIKAHLNIAMDPSLTSLIKDLTDAVTCQIFHVNLAKHV